MPPLLLPLLPMFPPPPPPLPTTLRVSAFGRSELDVEEDEADAPALRFAALSLSRTRSSSRSLRVFVVPDCPTAAGRLSPPSPSAARPTVLSATADAAEKGLVAPSAFPSSARSSSWSRSWLPGAAGAAGATGVPMPGMENEKSESHGDVGVGDGGGCGRWPASRAACSRRLTRISFFPETGRRWRRRNSLSWTIWSVVCASEVAHVITNNKRGEHECAGNAGGEQARRLRGDVRAQVHEARDGETSRRDQFCRV